MSLAKAMVKNAKEHDIGLFLNESLPDALQSIRNEFKGLIPDKNIFLFNPPLSVHEANSDNFWRTRSAEIIREYALFNLKPDIVHVMSLFEGLVDEAVSSIGFAKKIHTALTLYDLIPLVNKETYLSEPKHKNWYYRKLQSVKNSNIILSISEYTKNEAVSELGICEGTSVNISAGVDDIFKPLNLSTEEKQIIKKHYEIKKDFIMYTGGIDPRKNIEGLIGAYAKLPPELRKEHQLVIVCSVSPYERCNLENLCKKRGLGQDEVIFTGFVSDFDIVALYNLCKLFVFPSLYEGFGLPALEAMACGAAVIGSNATSIPEVIGNKDALFYPNSEESIALKIKEALTDKLFYDILKKHGIKQAKKFSWDKSAKSAIAAFEDFHKNIKKNIICLPHSEKYKPKLAYISPLRPLQSGISDYSSELLPELSKYYDIEVVVEQKDVTDDWVRANYSMRNTDWFRKHIKLYDRVLYHFGNSQFHMYMFKLIDEIPGAVVLHDFFLSNVIEYMEINGFIPNNWTKELYYSHGYKAAYERLHTAYRVEVLLDYPVNLNLIHKAKGIIVHSDYARKLADKFYGENASANWHKIPLLRCTPHKLNKNFAIKKIGLDEDDFIICCFGIMRETKLNHRLLNAFITSTLSKDKHCKLIFVGKNNDDYYYSKNISEIIKESGIKDRIIITGWTDIDTFRAYLSAADIAVQIRTSSRGETSASVLDCMNYGLPVIVNANGYMAELPTNCVLMLKDEFSDEELVNAIETLKEYSSKRAELGENAFNYIRAEHNPKKCAELYMEAIEEIYSESDRHSLTVAIAKKLKGDVSATGYEKPIRDISKSIVKTIPLKPKKRQIFLDISVLVKIDAKSGIQRVVKSLINELLKNPPNGYYVEPVYATMEHGYFYAREFTMRYLDCPDKILQDEPIEYNSGDIFFGLDLQPHIMLKDKDFYIKLRKCGVKVLFLVYDILPVSMPQYFLPETKPIFEKWLEAVSSADGVVCISQETADCILKWLKENKPESLSYFKIFWNHIGTDIKTIGAPNEATPDISKHVISDILRQRSFIIVGTL
jgi:glycosyltransferase involved in cell wall biosynthesis